MREPLKLTQGDTYERPNQKWVCGSAEDGMPCPIGPTAAGFCSHAAACHPVRDGDRWVCNRSALRGGTCEAGPTPEGECCQHYSCSPVRSMRSKRGRFVTAMALVTLGGLCMVLSSHWRNEIIAPGELTVHHAQLVAQGGDFTSRCASCHVAGNQSFLDWVTQTVRPELQAPSQSDLCMECHKKSIPTELALVAHNVDPGVLLASHHESAEGRRANPSGLFACATCHQEHHGAAHDLKAMTDSACQACHSQQYHSFATDHPEITNWPEARRTRIAFDHATHLAKHFPAEKQPFVCANCHQQSETGFQQTLGYEQSCAKCHDSDIQASWEAGLSFVSLPMIDAEALTEAGHDIGRWPESATGDFDGPLPNIAKFLLASDDKAAKGMTVLRADFDFYDVDPDDLKQLDAAASIVKALKQLLDDLGNRGHQAIQERIEKNLGRSVTLNELSAIVAHLSSENAKAISQDWFAEPLTAPPTPTGKELIAGGGWHRDDVTFTLRYHPTQHADPWLTGWINLFAEATRGPQQSQAKAWLLEVMKPTSPGMCGSCHSVDSQADGSLVVEWFAKQEATSGPKFTVFSHAPHVLQTQLADCGSCHRLAESAAVMETYAGTDPHKFAAGFHHFTKQECATCHKPGAAGDSCTQCHRYHAGNR